MNRFEQPRIKAGDVLEAAIWLDGQEKPEHLSRFKAEVIQTVMEENAEQGLVTGPWRWETKLPGDERVPEVPDHIQGLGVCLLVGEADVLAVRSQEESRFLAELEPSDLRKLRKITRKAHFEWWRENFSGHEWPRPTDRQCDTLINDLGPIAGEEALRKGWTRLAANDVEETVH